MWCSSWLWRWKKEPEAKECRWTLEVGTDKGEASPLKPSQGTQPCQHLDFSPMRFTFNFWPQGSKIIDLSCLNHCLWWFAKEEVGNDHRPHPRPIESKTLRVGPASLLPTSPPTFFFFLPPLIFPSIRVFSNESALCSRWPEYWSFSFSISPSREYSGLISFRIDWFDFLAVQGTLKSLLQHHSSKVSILRCSAFFMVQLSQSVHDYWKNHAAAAKSLQSCLTLCDPIDSSPPGSPVPGILQARVLEWGAIAFSGKTIVLTIWIIVGKVMSLLFNKFV